MRASLNDLPTPESVQKQWHKVTDMSNAKHLHTSADAMKNLMEKLEYLGDEQNNNKKQVVNDFSFGSKDFILYALGSKWLQLADPELKRSANPFLFISWSNGVTTIGFEILVRKSC